MDVTQERERAVNRGRKVFRHGASTTASGEKEKIVAVLIALCQKYGLVLHDLDPQFPKRLDIPLLRVKIGLAQATPSAPGTPHGPQRPSAPGAQRSGGSGQQGQRQSAAGAASHQGAGTGADPQELLRVMGAAERRRWLQGPTFSQGIRRGLQHTRAYGRLLGEVRSLNNSNMGADLSEPELMRWFEAVLSCPGSSVPCLTRSKTVFDDLAAYCRTQYLAEAEQRRQTAQRRKAEEERQRAEQDRADRERRAAERRRHAEKERRAKERGTQSGAAAQSGSSRTAGPPNGAVTFSREFEHSAEAQLYLKVAQCRVGPEANLRFFTRQGRSFVELTGSPAVRTSLESVYLQALHDLQTAAATIRAEAARVRDETLRQAEATYAQHCEAAFQAAVDSYAAGPSTNA